MKKNYLTREERETLESLIEKAKAKYGVEKLLTVFISSCDNWKERDVIVKAVMGEKELKEDIIYEAGCELKVTGHSIVKIQSMEKQNRFNEFMCMLFPYYNEQTNLELF